MPVAHLAQRSGRRALASLLVASTLALAACSAETSDTDEQQAGTTLSGTCYARLPHKLSFDAERAKRGEALFREKTLAPGVLPEFVVRNLWVAWGSFLPPADDATFWLQARARYGMLEAPFDNGGLPLGMRREGSSLTFDCMLCHAGNVDGQLRIGAANHTIDLEAFFDDLLRMAELAPSFGFSVPPIPYDLDGLTYAAGAQDAFGLGFRFAGSLASGLHTEFGPQKAPAWWLLKHKDKMYADGSGEASGHHSVMATLVAFGLLPDQWSAREEDFVDIIHFVRSIESPCWQRTELDTERVQRGEKVFEQHCVTCHGAHTGSNAAYPNQIVAASEVGTDPMRATNFGDAEAMRLNLSWFGEPPFVATGGYVAPPLVGIWARAPYFHNGSVPTLEGVLDPKARPKAWRRVMRDGTDFDAEKVGLYYEEVSAASDPNTRVGRLVYDTTRPGMSNAGHSYGAVLTAEERADLLEYLRGL